MKKILIMEDDADISLLLCKILKKAGYETETAFSGTEGLLRLDLGVPDLILLDLMLPGMSGEEVLRRIREEKQLELPVVILSAKADLQNKVENMIAGADALEFSNDTRDLTQEEADQIFQRFYTGEQSRTRGSTGLGLTVSKSLAERMGGTLTAHLGEDGWLRLELTI